VIKINYDAAIRKILITVPRLHEQGGVSGFYNAVLPHFQPGLVTPLQVGGVGGRGVLSPLMDQLHFRGAIRKKEPDLVLINPSLCFKCLVRDGLFAWQTKESCRPLVVFWHGWNRDFERQISTRYRGFFLRTFGRADAFIVLARDFERKLREWGVEKPVFCSTTAVEEELLDGFFVERKGKEFFAEKTRKILFLARLERSKGVLETVKAVKILLDQGQSVSLTVAGDGPIRQELETLSGTLNLGPRQVTFAGDVRGRDKARLFGDHHMYCFPTSYGEGLPTSVLEAMAFAMPVVTSHAGGLADMFEDGKMGRVVCTNTPEEVAACLAQLLDNPEKMAEIARFNGEYARKHFMGSVVKNRLMAIYQAVR